MSLKHFHFVFITASWLLAFAFAGWCFVSPDADGSFGFIVGGIFSLLLGIALVIYHVWARKKMRQISAE